MLVNCAFCLVLIFSVQAADELEMIPEENFIKFNRLKLEKVIKEANEAIAQRTGTLKICKQQMFSLGKSKKPSSEVEKTIDKFLVDIKSGSMFKSLDRIMNKKAIT